MKLDYLSFTITGAGEEIRNSVELYWVALGLVRNHLSKQHEDFIFQDMNFIPATGRPPYRYGSRRMDGGVTIFGHPDRDEILFECTGTACASVPTIVEVQRLVHPIKHRVTRIDLAIDWETLVRPDEFIDAGYSERFKSRSSNRSNSGHTEYVGSQKSDLMARVYRYHKPHPRSHLLRMEAVFRRDRAKDCCDWLVDMVPNDDLLNEYLCATFGWKHKLAKAPKTAAKIPTTSVKRDTQSTVYWLYQQVTPALVRLHQDGSLNWSDFAKHIEDAIRAAEQSAAD